MPDLTIDSKGNVVPKPYGVSRWANPRRYECKHEDCKNPAKTLFRGCEDRIMAHNCCREHLTDSTN